MSRNLVELVRRHHEQGAPTALDVLKEAMDQNGEITDDDRRLAAERSGLPEATVHGVSTFYEDLLVPRGRRHVRVCTGTACFAATGDAHVDELAGGLGLSLGERSDDGSLSLAETVCLGYCHASPAVRDGDVIDAGPDAIDRVLADAAKPAPEPLVESLLDEPVLTRSGDWSGLRKALAETTPELLLDEVKAAEVRGRGGAGFLAGVKWEFARNAEGEPKFIVANGDEGDPGSYIDKVLMEDNPHLFLEGMALAGLRRRREPRLRARALGVPALQARAGRRHFPRARGGPPRRGHPRLGLQLRHHRDRGRGLLRRRRGDRSARLPPGPARHGLRAAAVPRRSAGCMASPPSSTTSRRSPTSRSSPSHGAEAYRALSPDATAGTKLVCFNERFERPGAFEVPFGMTVRELCEDVAGGMRDGRSVKAVQIGGPLGGILPASRLDAVFDFEPLVAEGCMVGHGGIVGFDDRTDMRDVARHLLHFGADESCGKCFPCRIGLRRAHEMFVSDKPVERARLEELLEALELGSLCAHGGGMPAPIRSLLEHFPEELGLA